MTAIAKGKVETDEWVVIGRIGAPFGIKGSARLHSFTAPEANILSYGSWYLKVQNTWQLCENFKAHAHGLGFLLSFSGITSPELVKQYTNCLIAIPRPELAPLPKGEYYWAQLEGLEVLTEKGESLGRVLNLFETGANDVLVVKGTRERLIPYVPDEVILAIDLERERITVRWDPDF